MTPLHLKSFLLIISTCTWFLFMSYKVNISSSNEQNSIQIIKQVILDNPLQHNKCRNAIVNKDNINITYLELHYATIVKKKCGHVPNVTNWSTFILTREFISSLSSMESMKSHQCYWQHHHFMSFPNQTDINDPYIHTKTSIYPKYYHIPKSGSSSIHIMLANYFNFVPYWQSHNQRGFKHISNWGMMKSQCAFTFVRHPIKRLISGYYTINKAIFIDCNFTFINCNVSKWNNFKFIKIIGEPQRFDMFVEEMINNPWKFANNTPFRHVSSQMFYLSNWHFFDDLKFIGKIEQFNNNWIELLNYCEWFKYQMKNVLNETIKYQLTNNITFVMRQFGFDIDMISNSNEYINALSLKVNDQNE
eukprot:267393_1